MKTLLRIFPFILLVVSASDVRLGAETVRAAETRSTPAVENILNSVSQQLVAHFNAEGDLKLDLLRPWTPSLSETATVETKILEFPTALVSSMLIRVRLQSGEKTLGEHTLLLRAQLFRDAWAARTPVERSQPLDPALLDVRQVDVLRERDALPVSINSADFTIVRSVAAGRLLTWRDVVRRSLVRKGEVIEVSAGDGLLNITMKALAMENGAAGETVRVRNIDSKKEFSALVVSEARAQVTF